MTNDFPINVVELYGHQRMYGDVTFSLHAKIVEFLWDSSGVTIGKGSSEVVIETDSGQQLSGTPGSRIPWEELSGQWRIRFPQSSFFAAGKIQYFESLSQLLDFSDQLSEHIVLEGIKCLIPKTYLENDLAWDKMQMMDGLAKRYGPHAIKAMNEMLAPYRIQAALHTMLLQHPPLDAVSLLHASFKRY